MSRRSVLWSAVLAVGVILPAAPPAEAWSGTIVCESHRYRRNFCRVDTQGQVRLVREISTGRLCRRGSGWGFDNRGIWVDRGCRGVFEFGRGRGGPRNNNAGAAVAAGMFGAMLGATMANPGAPPPVPPPPMAHVPVPVWAIGSFQAWDPQAHQILQLIVQNNGRVTLRDERGGTVNTGLLRDGMVFWDNGHRAWFAREDPGVMLGDVETGTHFNFRRS